MSLIRIQTLADFPPIANLILKMTVLLAAVWGLHLAIRHRNPRWRVFLWRGAVVGIVVLPLLGVVAPELRLGVVSPVEPEPFLVPIQRGSKHVAFAASYADTSSGWAPVATTQTVNPAPAPPPSAAPSEGHAMEWVRGHCGVLLASAWAGVTIALILFAARAYGRSRRVVRSSKPAPNRTQVILGRVAADLKCRRKVALLYSPHAPSPLLSGIFRPRIILPQSMAGENAAADLAGVFAHELAHVKSGDLLWSRFLQVTSIILWFHPFVWRVRSAHSTACEQACDAVAAAYVGDAQNYSGTLARVALRLLGQRPVPATIPMARKPQIWRRLAMLKNKTWASQLHRRSAVALLLAGIVILAGLAGLKLTRAQSNSAYESNASEKSKAKPAEPRQPGSRVVRFPRDRSLGSLYIQDEKTHRQIETLYHWINGTSWQYFGEAVGDVAVPPGMRLRLAVSPAGWQDLSPLSRLRPHDLYALSFLMLGPGSPTPDDRCMPYIGLLTGLKDLSLWQTNVTDKGMRFIKNLQNLEYLVIPEIGDTGFAYVTTLTSLKGLYLKRNSLTNAGLAQIASLESLEELEIGGRGLNDAGLVHLAKLPSLTYLLLWGPGFSEAGLVNIAKVPSLEILNMSQYQVTEAGLEHLTRLPKLHAVSFSGPPVTGKGFSYLKRIPSLKLLSAPFGDNALVHLKDIKSLESLDLPGEKVKDEELAFLSELPNLKHLRLRTPSRARSYTDKGLEYLSRVRSLEELTVCGVGVTDAGMSHIGKLANLKDLTLFGCPITGKGLAELTKLRSLKELFLYASSVTLSDLAQLNAIPSLTYLRVQQIERGPGVLDIGKLTQLEKLTISLEGSRAFRDEDLACLAKLTRLKWLQGIGGISDAGMAHLAGLTSMERLSVGGPGLTDKGMAYLANMKNLDNLSVTGDFTDEGLRYLEALTGLRSLNITSEGAFTNAALNRLRKRLPNLQTLSVIP